ncbi:MAG: hypothetical protein K0R65_1025 [Crocinitomicaceae bacterium]|jgi:hypothetical protein|nr:hypothetical protein [Crocinitomicaceae bacterium]
MNQSFIFILGSVFSALGVHAQEDPVITAGIALPQDKLYILEDVEKYQSGRRYSMDENDCYFQVLNGYVVLSYRSRSQNGLTSGKISSSAIKEVEGEEIITFTVISDGNFTGSKGNRSFFGIKNTGENRFVIYQLGNTGLPVRIFNAHVASAKEKTQLMKRSAGMT